MLFYLLESRIENIYFFTISFFFQASIEDVPFLSSNFLQAFIRYTRDKNVWGGLILTVNHKNHWVPPILPYNLRLVLVGMKQKQKTKKIWNKIQNDRLKKSDFFKTANSQYFFAKSSGIGPWVGRHQCGKTYMVISLSDVRSKTE